MKPDKVLCHFESDGIVYKPMAQINPNQHGLFWHEVAVGGAKRAPCYRVFQVALRSRGKLSQWWDGNFAGGFFY